MVWAHWEVNKKWNTKPNNIYVCVCVCCVWEISVKGIRCRKKPKKKKKSRKRLQRMIIWKRVSERNWVGENYKGRTILCGGIRQKKRKVFNKFIIVLFIVIFFSLINKL